MKRNFFSPHNSKRGGLGRGSVVTWASKANFVVTALASSLVLIAANKSISWIVPEKNEHKVSYKYA